MARVQTKVCAAQLPKHAARKKRCIIHTEYISLFSDLLNPSSVILVFFVPRLTAICHRISKLITPVNTQFKPIQYV